MRTPLGQALESDYRTGDGEAGIGRTSYTTNENETVSKTGIETAQEIRSSGTHCDVVYNMCINRYGL